MTQFVTREWSTPANLIPNQNYHFEISSMVTVPHYVRSGLRTATVTNQDEYSTIPQSVICNSSGNLAAPVINCDSATLNSITISWNQGTSNINGYRLYIRE